MSSKQATTPEQTWRELYKLFDPKARLEVNDQNLYVDRPGTVAASVLEDLNEGLEPEGKWVVCGSMGSGKSSELVHLTSQLQTERLRMVIGLDLPKTVTRVDLIRPPEVLFLIGAAALRALEDCGQTPDPQVVKQLLSAFQGLQEKGQPRELGEVLQGVALFAASVAYPTPASPVGAFTGAARTVAALARRPAPIVGTTRIVGDDEPELERLREAVDAALSLVRDDRGRPPVVVVDGLDKVQDRGAIRTLFTGSRALCMPRAQIVFTGPITLMLGTEWNVTGSAFKRERLANVAVHRPNLAWVEVHEEKIERGRAALRQVMQKRLQRLDLQADQVFAPGVQDRLIDASGGLLRDLIHLVNRAVRAALRAKARQIGADLAEEAVIEIRKEYEVTMNGRRVEELRYVREHGEPSGSGEVSSELLLTGYVLPYANGKVWFEPHPILRGLRPGL